MAVPSRHTNPFASCWIHPQVAPQCVASQTDIARLLDLLQQNAWLGAIVGPHGVGKSTLLEALVLASMNEGKQIHRVEFHNRQTRSAWKSLTAMPIAADVLLVVDGFEQLSWWQRWWLIRRCKAHGAGLLVTSHRPTMLPTLSTLAPNLTVALDVYRQLVAEKETEVAPQDVVQAFEDYHGNLREILFHLYDLHEQRSRTPQGAN